jgi:hypothetical protein
MFDDIVICEIAHNDPDGKENCNPHQIKVGSTSTFSNLLISMLFTNDNAQKVFEPNIIPQLKIFAEVLGDDKQEYKDEYDIQTGIEVTITEQHEIYKMIIGSNGENFHYFTNLPSINNTTSYGDTIFLCFPHTVEGFQFKDQQYKIFK